MKWAELRAKLGWWAARELTCGGPRHCGWKLAGTGPSLFTQPQPSNAQRVGQEARAGE